MLLASISLLLPLRPLHPYLCLTAKLSIQRRITETDPPSAQRIEWVLFAEGNASPEGLEG